MKRVSIILGFAAFYALNSHGLLAQTAEMSNPSEKVFVQSGIDTNSDANSASVQRPPLTLSGAMAHMQTNSAVLQAAAYQQEADIARAASKWDGTPNPELSLEAEDFLGNGVAHGVDSFQITTSVSQEMELGKKVTHRKNVRASRRDVSALIRALVQQNLRGEVALAFLDVLAQQARLKHAKEMVALSQKTVETITAKVEEGRSAGMEQEKARVEFSLAKLTESDAARALDAAKVSLSAVCGKDAVFFSDVIGYLNTTSELPELNELLSRVQKHPALLVANATVRHQQALADAEKANGIPNVTFALGFRWNNASSNHAMVAGVGMPIPLMDRNRGNIDGATKEVQRAESEMDAKKTELVKALTTGYQMLAYELQRLEILQNEIIPSVETTFSAVEEGYRIGRFGYLDLLDAQRTLFEVKNMLLDTLVHYQAARIILNRTAGLPISKNMFDGAAPSKTTSKKEKP